MMTLARLVTLGIFAACVIAGTILDVVPVTRSASIEPDGGPFVLAGDLHVHAFPADGALPVWEIQREAARRGLDVVAIANHNRNFAMPLAEASGLLKAYPIVIPADEVTAPGFHIVALGVNEMIDWRLSAREAIDAIHAQGGVAIAAHPIPLTWRVPDDAAVGMLDGAEAAHPLVLGMRHGAAELETFYRRGRAVKPHFAPVGSSDFHVGSPLGLCRTYIVADAPTREGVLDAIRRGRTVAAEPGDRLTGTDENVRAVRAHLQGPRSPRLAERRAAWIPFIALLALAAFVVPSYS